MKRQASFIVNIPTIGHPFGKPTRHLDKMIRPLIDARREAETDEERDYYNNILDQAYAEKYDGL